MANYFARKAGNINATDVWATTPSGTAADVWSTFTSADVLHSNSFAITVNVSTTVGSVRNDNANGATASGSFTLSNGVTLTANVFQGSVNSCIIYAGTSGNSATVNGDINGSTTASITAVTNNSSGTLNINGNVTGGTVSNSHGVSNASTGSVVITGNVTAGTGVGAVNSGIGSMVIIGDVLAAVSLGVSNSAGGTMTITGNVTGGTSANAYGANNIAGGTMTITGNVNASTTVASGDGARNAGSGTLNITGDCFGKLAIGVTNNSTGITNITGNCTGGSGSNSDGIRNASTGTVTITGNVTGGTIASGIGANNNSTGTLTIIGSATASNLAFGANNQSTGILNVKRAVGNGWGIGTVGINSAAGVSSVLNSSQTRVEEFEFGALGQVPVAGAVSCPDLTTNVCIVHRLGTTKKTLVDSAASANYPAANNVRSGTSYNFGNTTGTLVVPSPSSVAFGVATDNTTGTAVLTPSAVWDALTSGMTTAGSIGERLKNAATVDTTGQALSDALSPTP